MPDESQHGIQLIVGLGNPGKDYAETRHNAGAWFVERLAHESNASFKLEPKFHAQLTSMQISQHKVWLLIPTTFMNVSGQAVRAVANFYQIPPNAILVAHDELDFPVGVVRLKQGGGHGGHNGLRDIISHLNTNDFYRLRIGIDHPGHRSQVHDYVLSRPSQKDFASMMDAINQGITIVPELVSADIQKAIHKLHTNNTHPHKEDP